MTIDLNSIDYISAMDLKTRLREVMEGAGLKKLQFAKAAGVSSGAVTQWLDGTTKAIKSEKAANLQSSTGYSAVWIATGKGEKFVATAPAAPGEYATPGAMEIAFLYDEIPVSDRIKRTLAWNAATRAILDIVQPGQPSVEPTRHHKKQRA